MSDVSVVLSFVGDREPGNNLCWQGKQTVHLLNDFIGTHQIFYGKKREEARGSQDNGQNMEYVFKFTDRADIQHGTEQNSSK